MLNNEKLQHKIIQLNKRVKQLEQVENDYHRQKKQWQKREKELEKIILLRTRQLAYVSQLLNELKETDKSYSKKMVFRDKLYRVKHIFSKLMVQK